MACEQGFERRLVETRRSKSGWKAPTSRNLMRVQPRRNRLFTAASFDGIKPRAFYLSRLFRHVDEFLPLLFRELAAQTADEVLDLLDHGAQFGDRPASGTGRVIQLVSEAGRHRAELHPFFTLLRPFFECLNAVGERAHNRRRYGR